MTLKKMMLLASMALAALAFAVPASASAYEWTVFGGSEPVTEGQVASDPYEGDFGFLFQPGNTGYTCHADLMLNGYGPDGNGVSTGEISDLKLDPESCQGSGAYAGCELTSQSNNLTGKLFSIASSPFSISNAQIIERFENCSNEYLKSKQLNFASLEFVPTLDAQGVITEFTLEGTDTMGIGTYVFGPFTPAPSAWLELGIQ